MAEVSVTKADWVRHLVLTSALAALLGACTPGRINYVHVDSAYAPQQYDTVPYTKAMRADVSGNPFNMPQEEFNRLVNEAIQAPGIVPTDASPYVIHFAFGTEATSINYACTAPGRAGGAGGTIPVTAAFCRGPGAALTYLAASVDGISDPHDPRFRQFLRSIIGQLFPSQTNDTRDHEHGCLLPGC